MDFGLRMCFSPAEALLSSHSPTKGELDSDMRFRERQYKRKISQWHLDKNVKDSEMQFIMQKQKKRKVFEDKDTAFRVRSRRVEPEKIARTIKRKNISEDALLSAPSPSAREDPPIM